MRIAFQGVHGAYSEAAAQRLGGRSARTIPCDRFEDVFRAVEHGGADRGILPIENSLAGSIHQNYDLLRSHRVHIVGETTLRIEHVLLCHPGATWRDLREVRSHPQALAQCAGFFARHAHLRPVPFFDTAGAAQSVMDEGLHSTGAIAGAFAARRYGLRILRTHLEDRSANFTRFLLIARSPWRTRRGVRVKTSISFAPLRNQVGILFRVLGVFALRDIDLLKIESRPDPGSPFDYLFYVDLAGGPHELRVARALDHLQEMVHRYRLLGVYPRARTPLS